MVREVGAGQRVRDVLQGQRRRQQSDDAFDLLLPFVDVEERVQVAAVDVTALGFALGERKANGTDRQRLGTGHAVLGDEALRHRLHALREGDHLREILFNGGIEGRRERGGMDEPREIGTEPRREQTGGEPEREQPRQRLTARTGAGRHPEPHCGPDGEVREVDERERGGAAHLFPRFRSVDQRESRPQ